MLLQRKKAMSGRDRQDTHGQVLNNRTAGGIDENRGPPNCIFIRELNTDNLLQATIELSP